MRRSMPFENSNFNTFMNTTKTSNHNFNNQSSKNSSNEFGRKHLENDPYKSAEIKRIKDYNDESY